MLKSIDSFLNSITMYRLVLWGLAALAIVSIAFGFAGLIPYPGLALFISLAVFVGFCFSFNTLLSKLFKAPANIESAYITGLILFFIYAPAMKPAEFLTVAFACLIAMASKYVIAVRKRHMFNPAAFAAVVLGLVGNGMAVWWIGSKALLIFVLIIGLAVLRKIRRFTLAGSFLAMWALVTSIIAIQSHMPVADVLLQAFVSWPVVFFAAIMLTEPLTTPPTQLLRVVYGVIIGVLFSLPFHVGLVFSTPELALVLGNIFSYFVSHKQKLTLRLMEKQELAPGLFEFVFEPDYRLQFRAGQFLEWTLPHSNPDNRGIRRYFTISSSPLERVLKLGVRFGEQIGSYKQALKSLPNGGTVYASHLTGDFVLPSDQSKKLVFIAGGIGITPFRSMVQWLIDTNQKRDIVLLYACASSQDFAYMDVFQKGREAFGLKTVQIVTDTAHCEPGFQCRIGYVDEQLLTEEVPDFRERVFYLSGPVVMVNVYKKLLLSLSIPLRNIVTDYFPGF